MLSAQLRETLRLLRSVYYVPNFYWSDKLRQMHIDPAKTAYHRGTNELELNELGVTLSPGKHAFLLQAYHHAVLLHAEAGASFVALPDGTLNAQVSGLTMNLRTAEEVYILRELFVDGIYNVLPCHTPTVFWDIGMNAGMASLYFAAKHGSTVIGFEPFDETFDQALRNVSLNPHLSALISCHHAGIGAKERSEKAYFVPSHPGRSSIYTEHTRTDTDSNQVQQTIELLSAASVLEHISERYPGHSIVIKMDCEGAEYEILEALASANLLGSVDAILMEWHVMGPMQDPSILLSILCQAGFLILHPRPLLTGGGMMYAFRNTADPVAPSTMR